MQLSIHRMNSEQKAVYATVVLFALALLIILVRFGVSQPSDVEHDGFKVENTGTSMRQVENLPWQHKH